jgi:hypothetical protein
MDVSGGRAEVWGRAPAGFVDGVELVDGGGEVVVELVEVEGEVVAGLEVTDTLVPATSRLEQAEKKKADAMAKEMNRRRGLAGRIGAKVPLSAGLQLNSSATGRLGGPTVKSGRPGSNRHSQLGRLELYH